MLSFPSSLATHLQQEISTLAYCWRLKRRDGVVIGITDYDHPISFDGVTYHPSAAQRSPLVASGRDLRDGAALLGGILSASTIEETDLLAGRYDHAQVELLLVNYEDATTSHAVLLCGWLGEVTQRGGQFEASVHSLGHALEHTIGAVFSPTCRVELGDSACGIDLAARTVSSTLSGVTSATVLLDSARTEAAATFTHGVLRFTSGNNANIAVEVKAYQPGQLTLMLPLPYTAQAGDAYTLSEGCDKRFATCRDRFANVLNFRGEPHMPGMDTMLQTSATRNL